MADRTPDTLRQDADEITHRWPVTAMSIRCHADAWAKDREELEQARVQLAGCLTAAEGATQAPAHQGDYGWSLAYQRTLELREELERLKAEQAAWERLARDVATRFLGVRAPE